MSMQHKSGVYKRLMEMGLVLPKAPEGLPTFSLVRPLSEGVIYISGLGPAIDGHEVISGKLGAGVSIEKGQEAARNTILNTLAVLHDYLGDLNRVTGFIKLLVFVASDPSFLEQPTVANGASAFLIELFGEEIGCSARSAVGVAVLPKDIPVEIEMIVKYS